MAGANRLPREEYLGLEYPFDVIADLDGRYVIAYPDLPGCMGQVETLAEVGTEAEEIRQLWIGAAYDQGLEIPLPTHREEYSGKFNVRLPKSLHRALVAAAEREGVSLNQYVTMLLARGDAQHQVARRLDDLGQQLAAIHGRLREPAPGRPTPATALRASSAPRARNPGS